MRPRVSEEASEGEGGGRGWREREGGSEVREGGREEESGENKNERRRRQGLRRRGSEGARREREGGSKVVRREGARERKGRGREFEF